MYNNNWNIDEEIDVEIPEEDSFELFHDEDDVKGEKKGKQRTEKKLDVNELIEKGKNGMLSSSDIDAAIEEFGYDMDKLDKLYETLEDNEIDIPSDAVLDEDIAAIEHEVERMGQGENMDCRMAWVMCFVPAEQSKFIVASSFSSPPSPLPPEDTCSVP